MVTAQIDAGELLIADWHVSETPAGTLVGPATERRITISEVQWMDERGMCALAHAILAPDYAPGEPSVGAALPDFRACRSYAQGACRLSPNRAACVFTQLADDEGWQEVRRFRRLPDGTVCTAASYAELAPLVAARPSDPAYRQLPDGTYCLAEHWDALNQLLAGS